MVQKPCAKRADVIHRVFGEQSFCWFFVQKSLRFGQTERFRSTWSKGSLGLGLNWRDGCCCISVLLGLCSRQTWTVCALSKGLEGKPRFPLPRLWTRAQRLFESQKHRRRRQIPIDKRRRIRYNESSVVPIFNNSGCDYICRCAGCRVGRVTCYLRPIGRVRCIGRIASRAMEGLRGGL